MQLTFLGTGTSQGVPVIGCDCEVCRSADPRDARLRTAALLQHGSTRLVFDAGPDFRQQMLRAGSPEVDALVLTHEHNDHIIGLDDVRPYNFLRRQAMPVYCTDRVAAELRHRFAYAFDANPYPGAPSFDLRTIRNGSPFRIGDIELTPIEVMHGSLPVLGFRFGRSAYLTDVRTIDRTEKEKLRNLDVLVLNALHHSEHHSHLNLPQALELISELKPRQAYLVHLSHRMGRHREVNPTLPPGVALAWDGLQVEA